jgi:uncharacterized membrane protein
MWITAILIIHILGAAVLFGTGIGTALFMWIANRTQNIALIAQVTRLVVKADWLFTGTAGVLQPISGFLLVYLKHYPPDEFWIWGSLLGYLIAGGCWLPVVYFQISLAKMAEASFKTGHPLPKRYAHLYRAWFWCGWPAFLSLMGVFFLMSARPI